MKRKKKKEEIWERKGGGKRVEKGEMEKKGSTRDGNEEKGRVTG